MYFGVEVAAIVERILAERLDDGGWNCEVENGSVRSSFDTTINVLDGLLEFERATGASAEVRSARRGGEEYPLEGGVGSPSRWNTLRALRVLRVVERCPDPQPWSASASPVPPMAE